MKLYNRLPLNLQFFSADDGGGGASGNPTPGADNESGVEETQKTFDDLLKDKTYQSEFDKRIAKALETAKSKWEAQKQAELEEAKTEAEKLAKMNAEQKAKYEQEKREAEYQQRLKDLTIRELKATAKETLSEKGLPLELAEVLNYTDAETCNKSIEAVKTAFQSAVEKAVNEKLKGSTPNKGESTLSDFDMQLKKVMGIKD